MEINPANLILILPIFYIGAFIGFYINTYQIKRIRMLRKISFIMPLISFVIIMALIFNIAKTCSNISFINRVKMCIVPHKTILIGMILVFCLNNLNIDDVAFEYETSFSKERYPKDLVNGVYNTMLKMT